MHLLGMLLAVAQGQLPVLHIFLMELISSITGYRLGLWISLCYFVIAM